jgi:hypothetical protein
MGTGGRTAMKETIDAFHDYANAPKCLRTAALFNDILLFVDNDDEQRYQPSGE